VKKRFKLTATGKVKARRRRQAPPPDQPQRQVHPPESRHRRSFPSASDSKTIKKWAALRAVTEGALNNELVSRRGVTARAKHKKVLDQAKGYLRSPQEHHPRRAPRPLSKRPVSTPTATARLSKRSFRSLWIQRINAAARPEGLTYSQFIHGLDQAGVVIDRKVLSDIAGQDPVAFKAIADKVRAALA
jgi:large subunit ribosomal protein L20